VAGTAFSLLRSYKPAPKSGVSTQMRRYEIPRENVLKVRNKRSVLIGSTAFLLGLIWILLGGTELSLESIGWLMLGSIVIGGGGPVYPWDFDIKNEAEWSLVDAPGCLEFHREGVVTRILGEDIKEISTKRKDGQPVLIEVAYGNQVSRIRHYEGMQSIYDHLVSIAGKNVKIQNDC